ncbi:unknown [Firmicutes bacterium CAG:24]|nr:unknown [Firmicutes bacterium CAG:24]
MSKNELRSSGGVEDAVHDNRMFAKRAFYCIANGASEL